MADNIVVTPGVGATIAADDVGGGVLVQRVKLGLGADGTSVDAVAGSGVMSTAVQRITIATDDVTAPWAFDVTLAPTVTNGAYSANDVMGALLTFTNCARIADEICIVTGVQVNLKSAVTPALTLILFSADPTGTTYTDNAAYSLAAADSAKVLKAIPVTTLQDHGTPNSYSADGLFIPITPVSGTRSIYGLLIDGTGVTLTSTSDLSIHLRGIGK